MSKRKENLNFNFKVPKIDPNSDDVFKIDHRLEKAIYSKRDTFVSFFIKDHKGKLQHPQFTIFYHPETDTYEFCNGPAAQAHFLVMVAVFMMGGGIATVRTALDEISHQKFLPNGRSMPVPFQEIRMFHSNGKKIEQVNAFDMFTSMVTNSATGKIELERYQQQEIYCDESGSFPAPELMEKLKRKFS